MKELRYSRFAWAALILTFPISVLAEFTDTKTLTADTGLNLDTDAVTAPGSGDVLWTGNSLNPQGGATAAIIPGATGAAAFVAIPQISLQQFLRTASNTSIPSGALPVGAIFGVSTNQGHSTKVLVAAISGTSITLQFTTFSAIGGSGGAPAINLVLNNSSGILAGFPNSGIAQGSLFKVLGLNLADDGDAALQDSQKGLPLTLNNSGVTIGASDGSTRQAALYYATPSQINGVLPANTPTGPGTLTVTHNGTPGAAYPITIVAAAPGLTTFNGSGVAQDTGRLTDSLAGLLTYTKSAAPGANIILWGTGFGATGNSDTTYDLSAHQTNLRYQIYIGGVEANISYKGNSVYPGVSVFGVTIPQSVPTGCSVPVAAVATLLDGSSVVSNIVTIPIHAGGGTCSDPQLGVSGEQISVKDTITTGALLVNQSTTPNGSSSATSINVSALFRLFRVLPGTLYRPSGGVSIGGCILTQTLIVGGPIAFQVGINAGPITVTDPGGSVMTLSTSVLSPGAYSATLSSKPFTGGAFVFNGGGSIGGVGAFTATADFPNPLLTWNNQSSAAVVDRTQGLTVTWTGGAPGSYITIAGTSIGGTLSGDYVCLVPQSAGRFTVPSYVMLGMPTGTGNTVVSNSMSVSLFSASGLDLGSATGTVSFTVNSTYN